MTKWIKIFEGDYKKIEEEVNDFILKNGEIRVEDIKLDNKIAVVVYDDGC